MAKSNLAEKLETAVWKPQEGSQTLFLACPIFEVLYHGTRGPGKTDALVMDFLQDVGKGYGASWRGILFRRTYPELADIVAKTKKWIPRLWPTARFNESKHTWVFPGGEELLLRYMDTPTDYDRYHGHEYPWIGWEELTNWPDAKCYEVMKACCRSSDARVPRKYRSTANPHGVGHGWVKMYFIDVAVGGEIYTDEDGNQRTHIKGHISENVILLDADPDYIKRLLSATASDPDKRKAWLDGDWDIVAGGIFDTLFKREIHILDPFQIPTSWFVDRAYDDGDSAPFSVGWFAESNGDDVILPDGSRRSFPPKTIFHIHEWYGWNGRPNEGSKMLPDAIARVIKKEYEPALLEWLVRGHKINPGPADSAIFDAARGNCVADSMETNGVTWESADKRPGSRIAGVKKFKQLLQAALDRHETGRGTDPEFYVFGTCKQFIRTVPVLMRDKKKPDDVDTDQEDHIWDMARYRVMIEERKTTTVNVTGI